MIDGRGNAKVHGVILGLTRETEGIETARARGAWRGLLRLSARETEGKGVHAYWCEVLKLLSFLFLCTVVSRR